MNRYIRTGLHYLGLFVIVVGLSVILGWLFDIALLKSVLPDYQTMKFNTAIGFILSGFALLALLEKKRKLLITLCSIIILLFFISLTEDITGLNLGIDELVVTDPATLHEGTANPGRPAPSTSLCFLLLGISLLLLGLEMRKLFPTVQYVVHLVTLISFIAITGYLFNVPAFYKLYFLSSMAVHTSVLLFLLSVGVSLIHTDYGVTALFFGARTGNSMIRMLFPQLVGILLVIGFLMIAAYRNNWLTAEFGIALHTTLFTIVALFLIGNSAGKINKMEEERNRSVETYKDLYENALVGVVTTDMKTLKTMMANDVAAKMFGYRDTAHFIKEYDPKKHFVDITERALNIEIMQREGELIKKVQEMKRLDGSILWLKLFIKSNTERSIAQTVVVDVSEQVISQNRLRDNIRELEIVNKELETFTFITSHDLQEPLRKIRNFISALQKTDEQRLTEEGKYYLGKIFNTSRSMQSLIEDLLVFSRIKNDRRNAELQNMNEIVTEIREELIGESTVRNAVYKIDPLCEIVAIRSQMEVLFKNLFQNSLKFSHPDRQPVIEVKSKVAVGSELSYEKLVPEQTYCHFSLTDNGIGFDPRYNERVFEIFERLHDKERYPGTGIGLAICKRIVENHRGYITASGQVDKGVRIDIYLPV